ncbi:hypothetical protein GCM10009817_07870 [Terrabacter lapilli]|uniref:Serine aminopeptidase S33 domain-containing protein n=1 Tax=Terrabacter lapilli TaxID=436231 RepID=A0ABN2RJZ4_9MICO
MTGGQGTQSSSRRGLPASSLLAFVLLVVGATCLAVGLGLAPHVPAEGLSVSSVLAVLLAVVGLVLIGLGVRSAWRTRRLASRLLVGPVAVVLVAVAGLTLGQAVAATLGPHAPLGDRTPASVGLRYEDVTARTADGVRLAGWYVPSTNGAAVVLCHGSGSTRSDLLAHAAALSRQGFGVLLLDARGHGGSAGRPMEFGWYGDLDLRAAVDVLATRSDVSRGRIGLVGLSMGGEEAIGALGSDTRVRAAVAEGATNRVTDDKAWLTEELGVRGWLQQLLDRLTYGATDLLTPAGPPPTLRASAAAAAPRPLLLVASAGSADEVAAARFIAAGSPSSVTVWLAPGGHTGALAAAPEQWSRRVGAFLDGALGVAR